ncbi:AAA family ATPase [Sneathiella chinensis]|uniref:Transcriptional regulator n=1 Tax=Sneathiella chinensis TaxID=349750 RepID=A0ABQ5U1J7_9PROT|nr:AAA family ATPase [Sneathiella chinensis]GLQ05065.1 transcriptional regulator [Sneathiella chinensis]
MGNRYTVNSLVKSHDLSTEILGHLQHTKKYRCISTVGVLGNHVADLLQGTERQILLVEIDFDNAQEIDSLAQIISQRGDSLSVVVTSAEATLERIRMLMRIGVADFLPQPITQEELLNVVDNAATRLGPNTTSHSGDGSVFTFMKAGGGSGATTVALQTAYSLMGPHRKNGQKRVCYLDFDLQFGNATLFLDLQQKHSVRDAIENADRMDGEFLKGIMAKHSSGLYVLPSPNDIIPLEAMTPQIAELIINIATEEFDHVVVDLPMSWTMWTNTVLVNSDKVYLIMQLSVKAIRQTRRILDMMAGQGLDEQAVSIIANRFQKTFGSGKLVRRTEDALNHRIDHFIANDYAIVSKSQDLGELIPMVKRRTAIEKQVEKLTRSGLDELQIRMSAAVGPA